MYATYGNIYHQYTPNVSIYTIHGSYGLYGLYNFGMFWPSASAKLMHGFEVRIKVCSVLLLMVQNRPLHSAFEALTSNEISNWEFFSRCSHAVACGAKVKSTVFKSIRMKRSVTLASVGRPLEPKLEALDSCLNTLSLDYGHLKVRKQACWQNGFEDVF